MLDPSQRHRHARRLGRRGGASPRGCPLWLAGGLSPENVARGDRDGAPVGWSTCRRGVETDGAKDPAKIAAFVRAAKEATV